MRNYLDDQRGIVSMLTVLFFSILIMIIALGTLTTQNKELRQSTDADQSVRAYFAAEAGLEQALNYLKVNGASARRPGCSGATNKPAAPLDSPDLGSGSSLEITCLKIGDNVLNESGTLDQEVAAQADLKGLTDVDYIDFSWHDGPLSAYSSNPLYSDPSKVNSLPAVPTGSWSLPALIEMTLYTYPTTSIKPSDIQVRTILLRPSSSCSLMSGSRCEASFKLTNKIQGVTCNGTTNLACSVHIIDVPTIRDFPDRLGLGEVRHVVRFRPRYTSTTYAVGPHSNGGSASLGAGGVKIDVTARAGGNIFRRLVAVSEGNGSPLGMGLDYAIFTRQDICKDFTVDPNTGKLQAGGRFGTGANCLSDTEEPPDDDLPGP